MAKILKYKVLTVTKIKRIRKGSLIAVIDGCFWSYSVLGTNRWIRVKYLRSLKMYVIRNVYDGFERLVYPDCNCMLVDKL